MTRGRVIPQRELRNNVSEVLREVQGGTAVRVTVRGKPVADLVPVPSRRDHFTPAEVEQVFREAPLDVGFPSEVAAVAGATIEEL